MRYLISGYYGFGNAGDEAVLAAIVAGLRRRSPGCEVRVLSAAPETTAQEHAVEAAQRWSLREVWRSLGWADVLLQGGGSLIQDATSAVSPLYYLGILHLARLRGVPAMVFAQGIGPIGSPLTRRLAGWELSRVQAVTVRDPEALAELHRLGAANRPSPELAADPALLLEPDERAAAELLSRAGIDSSQPVAVIALRDWPGVEAVAEACRELVKWLADERGVTPLAVAFQPCDAALAASVADAHPDARAWTESASPAALLGLVGRAELVVAMRLHGLIFAAAQAVPAIGLAYDPKVAHFAAIADLPLYPLDACDPAAFRERASALLDGRAEATQRLQARAVELRRLAEVSFDALERLAASRGFLTDRGSD